MKILLINTKETVINLELVIQAFNLDWTLFHPVDFDEANEIYDSHEIDFIIIDYDIAENIEFIEQIIKTNPKQKTITITEVLACMETYDCINCMKHLKRKRILKPVDIIELYDTISNFDNFNCKYFKSYDKVEKIIPKYVQQFNSCSFDQTTNVIECDMKHIYNLIEIMEFLDKHDIAYEPHTPNKVYLKLK